MSYLNQTRCNLQPAVLIKFNSTTYISCECSENFQKSFVTEHFWTAGTKLFNTSMPWNIHDTFCCHVGMCIYIKYGLRGKLNWNCYVHALVHQMWMRPIGQFTVGERNCKELEKDSWLRGRTESWELLSETNLLLFVWRSFQVIVLALGMVQKTIMFEKNVAEMSYYYRYQNTMVWL